MAGQASAEVTFNIAMNMLEMLAVQKAKDKDLTTPPGSPADGDIYLLFSTPATDTAWTGKQSNLAGYYNGAWLFIPPYEGMRVRLDDEDFAYYYTGSSWTAVGTTYARTTIG